MLKNYLTIAWRNLWRHKGFSSVNVLGLSVGMAAAMLILLWVQNEWNFDGFHEKSDRIFRVTASYTSPEGRSEYDGKLPFSFADVAEANVPEIDRAVRLYIPMTDPVFKIGAHSFTAKNVAYVDPDWFDVFDYKVVGGTAGSLFQDPHSVVLTEAGARRCFGNADPVGRMIQIDTTFFLVSGVVRDNPVNSSFRYDYLIPVTARSSPEIHDPVFGWAGFFYITFMSLREGTEPSVVAPKLTDMMKASGNAANEKYTLHLQALRKLRFDTTLDGDEFAHTRFETVILFGVVGLLILVIACVNYINLFAARASLRIREDGVKRAIGASGFQLAGQRLIESALTGLISLAFAIVFVPLALPVFGHLTGYGLWELPAAGPVCFVPASVFIVFLLVTGIHPFFVRGGFPVGRSLMAGVTANSKVTFRRKLVVGQFVVSIILLTGTCIIRQQWNFILQNVPVYEQEAVLAVSVPVSARQGLGDDAVNDKLALVARTLESRTGFGDVTVASESLFNITQSGRYGLDWNGRSAGEDPVVTRLIVQADFNDVFGLEMARGRWFHDNLPASRPQVILNETAVEALGIEEPVVGQRLYFPDENLHEQNGEIIGVVRDFHFKSLHEKITPLIIIQGFAGGRLFAELGAPAAAADKLAVAESVWEEVFPGSPFEYQFLGEEFARIYQPERRMNAMFSLFSGVAIVIACLGLLGLAAFAVERRVKEIGIRKVLGASIPGILLLLSRDFAKMILLAMLIATPVAWYAADHWLQDFAYRVDLRWWMFVIPATLTLVIALLTVTLRSVKAALASPARSLRSE